MKLNQPLILILLFNGILLMSNDNFKPISFDENLINIKQLMDLNELELSIKANGHLPGIPSAQHVKENGIAVGEMQKQMMTKIEELTLYIIQLKKENDEINKILNEVIK